MSKARKEKSDYLKEKKDTKEKFDLNISDQADSLSDKKLSSDTIESLKLDGTNDLVNKIKIISENLENKINFNFDKSNSDFGNQIKIAEQDEKQIGSASDSSKVDADKLGEAKSKSIDTGISNDLRIASDIAKEDAEWLKNLKSERDKTKREVIKKNKEIWNEIKNIRMGKSFKGFKFNKKADPKPGERIEVDEKGRRLKKYGGSETSWPENTKVQEVGESHQEQQRKEKNKMKVIKDFFEDNYKGQ